ncbi:IscS subfamily cysteine desulfurase [Buchnera aphidicola (Mindarus keteleerifoliae)]|uniref:IscS subfamily cysteine desulfurase n=1 Tax=Buchnera aphidicola TaxID=9 RepID=UPI0031B6A2D7
MKIPIYLDYAATTPTDTEVLKKMKEYLTFEGKFGNAASRSHQFGWKAEEAVDIARTQIADLINVDFREIIFTSGATESNNLAIKGLVSFYKNKGTHIITSEIEHKSVLDTCKYLETQGFSVTYLAPKKNGLIDTDDLELHITKKTILVSIMHVNNEIGVIQNIKKISEICKQKKIFFHVDATQSVGKIPLDLKKINIDLMSFSAHKIYGPKGIGGLYVRRKPRVRLVPQIHGGGHERGMRSGTLPVHQIVGMGKAFEIAKKNILLDYQKLNTLRLYFWNKLKNIEEVFLNSSLSISSPYILNISFNYIEGESLMMALKDLAVSSGSACTSESLESSYVLRALGIKDELAHSSIRFSMGKFTTKKEIDFSVKIIKASIKKLRILSPLWEMFKSGVDLDNMKWNIK